MTEQIVVEGRFSSGQEESARTLEDAHFHGDFAAGMRRERVVGSDPTQSRAPEAQVDRAASS